MPAMVITPDGWSVPRNYLKYLRFMIGYQPPRPGAFWFQFKADATNRLPWLF